MRTAASRVFFFFFIDIPNVYPTERRLFRFNMQCIKIKSDSYKVIS